MSHNSLILLLILVNSLGFGLADQTVFGASSGGQQCEAEGAYRFKWPIKQVAIIGAGISGLHAYNTLLDTEHFTKIRMFERDDAPGGNWHYSDETPDPVPIVDHLEEDWWKGDYTANMPTTFPFTTTYTDVNAELREKLESHRKSHRAPKPVWKSLNANAPSAEMKIPGFPWPAGQTWLIHHTQLTRYLRAFSSWLGINVGDKSPVIDYNTRVELTKKRLDHSGTHNGWTLVLKKFVKLDEQTYEESWWEESFDAVVVASSHYQHPHYPVIPGLAELQHRYPESVIHSAQYRQPERFAGQNVIVVGDSSSGSGISLDINQHVNSSYISMRAIEDDKTKEEIREIELSKLPCNTTPIPDILAIHLPQHGEAFSKTVFELRDRRNLTGINSLVLATGYRYAFPFLPDYHNTSFENTVNRSLHRFVDEQPIVTNGRFARSLYLDTFYVDQPTIAFQILNDYIQTLIYCKYTGNAIAKVWAGQAHLPTRDTMWSRFWDQAEQKGGLNVQLQWLVFPNMYSRIHLFVSWLNAEALKTGGKMLDLPAYVNDEEKIWTGYVLSGPEGKGRCVHRPVFQPEHELDEAELYQLEPASEW